MSTVHYYKCLSKLHVTKHATYVGKNDTCLHLVHSYHDPCYSKNLQSLTSSPVVPQAIPQFVRVAMYMTEEQRVTDTCDRDYVSKAIM